MQAVGLVEIAGFDDVGVGRVDRVYTIAYCLVSSFTKKGRADRGNNIHRNTWQTKLISAQRLGRQTLIEKEVAKTPK